jgi:shikimate 5-dehydrogenase
MKCNKTTKLYGSFSLTPGDRGSVFFNEGFERHGINALYKSFYISDIRLGMEAARTLMFSGIGIASPYKQLVLDELDDLSDIANKIQVVNTVVRDNNDRYVGYNTDYTAVKVFLTPYVTTTNPIVILGNGGLAKTVEYAVSELNLTSRKIIRKNWADVFKITDSVIFNCTPIELPDYISQNNQYITANVTTDGGMKFHRIQAEEQYILYVGRKYDSM